MRPIALATLALAVAFAGGLHAQEAPPRQIVVSGAAEAEAVPDLATVTAGVETRDDTAAASLAANSEAMTAVFAALEAAGVARNDMQTSQLSINPVYEPYREGGTETQKVVAYQTANLVTVRVRDVGTLGAIIDAVTEAGSNRLFGVSFDVSEPRPYLDTAREQAVADARAKAELYARAAGVTLGPVTSIRETVHGPGPMMMRADAAVSAAPVAEGTVTLQAQVEIVYAIE